ncbi:MAG: NAD(P)/FAD-dependent oxidoreductase [Clostridiaceae bacterium]|nr:NAD(P)/FAD-dependent oxidoreductase [Clostridiaceae bacterium]
MNIAIVGAGITGITAGFLLSQKGNRVTVYEKENYLGGLASSLRVGNEDLERFYHHFFTNDSYLLSLIDELNIKDRLNWYKPKNAIYIDNSIYPFTTPLDLLYFKPLSFVSRIRMGIMVLASRLISDYSAFETITAKEWIIKNSGQEAWEKIWEPLIKSKFDIDSENISGTWIWNKLKLRSSSRGKNLNNEMLGYLDGSFNKIFKIMAEKIHKADGRILLNNEVTAIIKNENGSFDIMAKNHKSNYDKVLFTGSPNLLENILHGPYDNYKSLLRKIRYKANICAILELSESLSPYYWITVAQDGLPFVLIIEHTNLVGLREYNSHIVYLSRYLDMSDPLYSATEHEIINGFISGLKKVFPKLNQRIIKNITLTRVPFAQPVITPGYSKIIPDIKTPVEGLYLTSMCQIYPEDRGLNYAVRLGRKAANEIMENL